MRLKILLLLQMNQIVPSQYGLKSVNQFWNLVKASLRKQIITAKMVPKYDTFLKDDISSPFTLRR